MVTKPARYFYYGDPRPTEKELNVLTELIRSFAHTIRHEGHVYTLESLYGEDVELLDKKTKVAFNTAVLMQHTKRWHRYSRTITDEEIFKEKIGDLFDGC